MPTLVLRTNAGAGAITINDLGIDLVAAGAVSLTLTDLEQIRLAGESTNLRTYVVDDAFGAGSSTIILNDGTSDIAQALALRFLDTVALLGDAGAFGVLKTDASNQVPVSVTMKTGTTVSGLKAGNAIDANNFTIENVGTPTTALQATNKAYVDAVAQGLDQKDACRALSDANLALTGSPGTVDGIGSWVTGHRILLVGQTDAKQNGPWVVNTAGAWTRPNDFLAGTSVGSAFCFIQQGTQYGDQGWVCTSDAGADVVGTDNLTWTQFSGAGQIVAGAGLTKTGNQLDVGAGLGITVNANDVEVVYGVVGEVVGLAGTAAAGVANKAARVDHAHTHGDRGADSAGSQHDDDQVDVEATLSEIGAPGLLSAVLSTINGLFASGRKAGQPFSFGMTSSVPGGGTRYMSYGGVVSSAVAADMLRAGKITGASFRVDVVDASRAYKLSIKKNGSEVASVALPTSTLAARDTTFSGVTFVAGDRISVSVERTSGTGTSSFGNASATVEIVYN